MLLGRYSSALSACVCMPQFPLRGTKLSSAQENVSFDFTYYKKCIQSTIFLCFYNRVLEPHETKCFAVTLQPMLIAIFRIRYGIFLILEGKNGILISIFFSIAPVLGWGRYETFEYGCTIAFHDDSFNTRSYVIFTMSTMFMIPFGNYFLAC